MLDRPAALHERAGEVIEQFRMRGWLAAHAEVARRAHERSAEMVHPDAIHEYARGEWVATIHNGPRQLQAAAAVVKRLALLRQQGEESTGNRLAQTVRIAAQKHPRSVRRGGVFEHHGSRRRAGAR